MADNYEGTKITNIPNFAPLGDLKNVRVMVVTPDDQFLLPMSALIAHIKSEINKG